jgi:hypothetical protein
MENSFLRNSWRTFIEPLTFSNPYFCLTQEYLAPNIRSLQKPRGGYRFFACAEILQPTTPFSDKEVFNVRQNYKPPTSLLLG